MVISMGCLSWGAVERGGGGPAQRDNKGTQAGMTQLKPNNGTQPYNKYMYIVPSKL